LEQRTNDYARHSTTSPFPALNIATGKVIGKCHRRTNGGIVIGIEAGLGFLADSRTGLLATTAENKALGVATDAPKPPAAPAAGAGGAAATPAPRARFWPPKRITPKLSCRPARPPAPCRERWFAVAWWIPNTGPSPVFPPPSTPCIRAAPSNSPLTADRRVNAVLHGAPGQVLASDPNFRAFIDGMNVLFLNAVFRGPAHARPARGTKKPAFQPMGSKSRPDSEFLPRLEPEAELQLNRTQVLSAGCRAEASVARL